MIRPLLPRRRALHGRHAARIDGWTAELITTCDARELRALARDARRGGMLRIRAGVYAPTAQVADLTTEQKHIVAMRAVALTARRPIVFSHWSAAVAHGLASTRSRLGTIHATFATRGDRSLQKVSGHVFRLVDEEVEEFRGLLLTTVPRTVVDVASSGSFVEGVIVADSALHAGLPRSLLEQAIDLAGPRKAHRAIEAVVAFADGRAGSAGESISRVTMHGMGLHPELQHRLHDEHGFIGRSDFFFPEEQVVGEFDGEVKFTDAEMAPNGSARAVIAEKWREDRGRAVTKGWARWGYATAWSARLLGALLMKAGVRIPRSAQVR